MHHDSDEGATTILLHHPTWCCTHASDAAADTKLLLLLLRLLLPLVLPCPHCSCYPSFTVPLLPPLLLPCHPMLLPSSYNALLLLPLLLPMLPHPPPPPSSSPPACLCMRLLSELPMLPLQLLTGCIGWYVKSSSARFRGRQWRIAIPLSTAGLNSVRRRRIVEIEKRQNRQRRRRIIRSAWVRHLEYCSTVPTYPPRIPSPLTPHSHRTQSRANLVR